MHISLIHQAALGDTLLLIPLLRALRLRFAADAPVLTLVTRPSFGELLRHLGPLDAWASADDPAHTAWFAPDATTLPSWAHADLLLSAVSSGHDAWADNARRLSPAALHYFSPRPPANYAGHLTRWHREQLAPLGLQEPPQPPASFHTRGDVFLHPGAGAAEKCWPLDRFLALARQLQTCGHTATFLLGEAEMERWSPSTLTSITHQFPTLLHPSLTSLASRLAQARLFVGNDSGITHLAAAVGIPTLALFGPSNDTQWRPVGPAVRVLRARLAMADLSVDHVAAHAAAALAENVRDAPPRES